MRALAEPPILQIGSEEMSIDRAPRRWRTLFPNQEFVRLDIEARANVDRVEGICAEFDVIETALDGKCLGVVICQHILEHVRKPWLARLALCDQLQSVDIYYGASGTGHDATYEILINGRVGLARTPFEIAGHFFQLEFDQQRNLALADFRNGKKLLIACHRLHADPVRQCSRP